jgi:hypothetical protein
MPIWGEAEKSAGSVVFSLLITDLLRNYLEREKAKQEARSRPTKTIQFEMKDEYTGKMLKMSFQGRWVIGFNDRLDVSEGWDIPAAERGCVVAAITAQGRIFYGSFNPDDGDYLMHYAVYDTVEQADEEGMPAEVLAPVAAELSEDYVEELSILSIKFSCIPQARGAGVRVKPWVEPKAEPQVRFEASSSP